MLHMLNPINKIPHICIGLYQLIRTLQCAIELFKLALHIGNRVALCIQHPRQNVCHEILS